MIAALAALTLVVAPATLDLPPEIVDPATATVQAERIDPPPPQPVETAPTPPGSSASAGGRCVGWEPLLVEHSPGWSVERMSRIMFRESRCLPAAHNPSGASGLLQVMRSHCGWLAGAVGPCDLFDAEYNVRAAAALWLRQGYRAWAL